MSPTTALRKAYTYCFFSQLGKVEIEAVAIVGEVKDE